MTEMSQERSVPHRGPRRRRRSVTVVLVGLVALGVAASVGQAATAEAESAEQRELRQDIGVTVIRPSTEVGGEVEGPVTTAPIDDRAGRGSTVEGATESAGAGSRSGARAGREDLPETGSGVGTLVLVAIGLACLAAGWVLLGALHDARSRSARARTGRLRPAHVGTAGPAAGQ